MNIVDMIYYIKYYEGNVFPYYKRCSIINMTYGDRDDIRLNCYGCDYCNSLIMRYLR